MAIITAYDALGRGLSMKQTGNFFVAASSSPDEPIGDPYIEAYDYNTVFVGQLYSSPSGNYIFGALITDYSLYQNRIDDIFILDTDGNLQSSIEDYNLYYDKNSDFSQGIIFTNILSGSDQIYGNSFSDYIKGGDGDDFLYGNAGDDLIQGGNGADYLDGGSGSDGADYSLSSYAVSVNLSTGSATGDGWADRLVGIEGAVGSIFGDVLIGDSADNFLFGTRGNDTLEGGDGVDIAAYQGNKDEYDIYYNKMNGKYTISDKVANRDGVDTLFGVEIISFAFNEPISIQSLLQSNAPAITSNGGRATAQASLPENGAAVTTVTATDVDAGTTLAYSISGGADAALFGINAATGALQFKKAPDFEAPTDAGANNVYDVIIQVSDGSLTDTQALAVTVQDLVNELLVGTSGADTLTGAGGNDTLKGGAGNDRLVGKSGADRMFGGAGSDTYYVENAGDRVYETASEASTDTTDLGGMEKVVSSISFTLSQFVEDLTLTGTGNSNGTGNAVANTILGNSGANTLKGLAGNDILKSGSGNDKLFGGAGKDTLTGGKGADIFVFDAAPASRDTITDFSRAEGDKIQLSKAVFKGFAYTGTLQAEDFYAAAGATTARDATDRVIYNTTTGILYYDADGAGGAAAAQVALLGASTHPSLLFSDLQIIA